MRDHMSRPLATALMAATALTATIAPTMASSHREAPGITQMPKVDGTDFYMFRSYEPGREDYTTFIANYQPIQAPYGGPNYFTMDDDAVYEIHIDNDGDAIEDITFQFDFDNTLANGGQGITLPVGGEDVAIPLRQAGPVTRPLSDALNERESYSLTVITGDRRSGQRSPVAGPAGGRFLKPLDNVGNKTIPNYPAYANAFVYTVNIPGCAQPGRVFVGQREEAFAINLGEVFDLVNLVPIQGPPNPQFPQYTAPDFNPNGIVQDRANDDLVGLFNVTSLAIEVPTACVTGDGNGTIGGWTTSSLPQGALQNPAPDYNTSVKYGGAFVQKSRLSAPLVNEVVIGLKDKNLFNAAEPTQDSALAIYVTNPTFPALLSLLFGEGDNIAPTNFPRADLVAAFLTGFEGFNQQATVTPSEMQRLNTAVPPTPLAQQSVFGVVAEDLAGFPNGRRPTDDVTDIVLRVAMGRLCHPLPLGAELGVPGAVEDQPSDNVNLGLCQPADAPAGTVPFTDGAPIRPTELPNAFPYLNTPIPGSPDTARRGAR